jgi:hypothetical protein
MTEVDRQRSLLLVTGQGGVHLLTAIAEALGHETGDPGSLDDAFDRGDRVVVPEPRLTTSLPAYAAAADRLRARPTVVLVVRHPAELRDDTTTDEALVSGWAGSLLGTEQATRRLPRAVVRHEDLFDDWQSSLARADKDAGARLLAPASLDQVDAAGRLVDSWPRVASADWAGLDLSASLRDLAARAHAVLCSLADGLGDVEFLDTLSDEYDDLAGAGR